MSQDGKDLEPTEEVNHEYSTSIRDCKQEKRNAKMQMTRLLNKLASVLTEDDSLLDIKGLLEKIQEQQENTLEVMTHLENAYRQKQDETMVEKVSDEMDNLVEQIDRETMPARSLLTSLTKVKSRANSVADSEASQRQKEKERAEMEARLRRDRLEWEIQQNREELERQDQELQAVNEEMIKRHQELEDAIEEELGIEKEVAEEFCKLPSQQKKSIKPNREKLQEKSPKESDKSEKHHTDFDHMYSVKTPPLEKLK